LNRPAPRADTHRQLITEVLSELPLQGDGCGLIDLFIALDQAHRGSKLILRHLLHADQQPAAVAIASRPILDERIDLPPPAKIEVANAEV